MLSARFFTSCPGRVRTFLASRLGCCMPGRLAAGQAVGWQRFTFLLMYSFIVIQMADCTVDFSYIDTLL